MKIKELLQKVWTKDFLVKIILVLFIAYLLQHLKYPEAIHWNDIFFSYLGLVIVFSLASILAIPLLFFYLRQIRSNLTIKKLIKLYFISIPFAALFVQVIIFIIDCSKPPRYW